MPNYQHGKIYKICGNGKIYVGSTTTPLNERLSGHKSAYKQYLKKKWNSCCLTSFECITDSNCYIELLESCPCNSREELHEYERKWMKQFNCVNKLQTGKPAETRKIINDFLSRKEFCI
jgi:predicted GIY-YIG superfamily endonuclease